MVGLHACDTSTKQTQTQVRGKENTDKIEEEEQRFGSVPSQGVEMGDDSPQMTHGLIYGEEMKLLLLGNAYTYICRGEAGQMARCKRGDVDWHVAACDSTDQMREVI